MLFIGYFAFGLCALRQFGVEATLVVTFEDIVVADVDTTYFDRVGTDGQVIEDDDGETTLSTNITLVKKLPDNTDVRLRLMGLSMGLYNVPSGIDVQMRLCETLNEPVLMAPFFSVLGFKKESCPPEPGFYAQEGYKLPMEALPDEFSENKYEAIFDFILNGKKLLVVNIFVDIQNSDDR